VTRTPASCAPDPDSARRSRGTSGHRRPARAARPDASTRRRRLHPVSPRKRAYRARSSRSHARRQARRADRGVARVRESRCDARVRESRCDARVRESRCDGRRPSTDLDPVDTITSVRGCSGDPRSGRRRGRVARPRTGNGCRGEGAHVKFIHFDTYAGVHGAGNARGDGAAGEPGRRSRRRGPPAGRPRLRGDGRVGPDAHVRPRGGGRAPDGVDVFIGAVLGPVIGGVDEEQSAAAFGGLTPRTAFLLPSLAFGSSPSPAASRSRSASGCSTATPARGSRRSRPRPSFPCRCRSPGD
jgi:hypothetical protein